MSVAGWTDRVAMRIRRPQEPSHQDLRLAQRNVFVLPTRAGLLYGLVLIAMLIGSINYLLSLGFALTFLLAGLALLGMLHTFRNLSGLVLRPGRAEPVFAGQPADVSLMLLNPGRLERFSIRIDTSRSGAGAVADVPPQAQQLVQLAIATERRGPMMMPRLRLSTEYPLGLFRAWAYWQPAIEILVYPLPQEGPLALPEPEAADHGQGQGRRGNEDLAALRPYQSGDPLSRIAWRAVARNASGELLSRQLEGGARSSLQLDWQALPAGMDAEAKISRLARWVIDAQISGERWSMQLPGLTIAEDSGPAHSHRCLEALARLEL